MTDFSTKKHVYVKHLEQFVKELSGVDITGLYYRFDEEEIVALLTALRVAATQNMAIHLSADD